MDIRGPSNLRILKFENRKFFLFGDIHNSFESACTNDAVQIDDLLFDMLAMYEKNSIPCDVFIEQSFTKQTTRKPQKESGYLRITKNRFRECLTSLKTQCPYKNIRFHYTDIRFVSTVKGEKPTTAIDVFAQITNREDILLVGNEILSNILHYVNIELSSQNYIEDVKASKIFQLNFILPETKEKVEQVLSAARIVASKIDGRMMSRVGKNLHKLEPSMRNRLYSYIINRILSYAIPTDDEKKLKYRCARISAFLMDCYTISRILQRNDRVIAYFGDYHIDTISDFFSRILNAEVIESVDSGKNRCIKSQYLRNEI